MGAVIINFIKAAVQFGPTLYNFLALLISLFTAAWKAYREWEQFRGERINVKARKEIASNIHNFVNDAIQTKDTGKLVLLFGELQQAKAPELSKPNPPESAAS
jgi:hypothetical protein